MNTKFKVGDILKEKRRMLFFKILKLNMPSGGVNLICLNNYNVFFKGCIITDNEYSLDDIYQIVDVSENKIEDFIEIISI